VQEAGERRASVCKRGGQQKRVSTEVRSGTGGRRCTEVVAEGAEVYPTGWEVLEGRVKVPSRSRAGVVGWIRRVDSWHARGPRGPGDLKQEDAAPDAATVRADVHKARMLVQLR
jgi:hypothetical protein